MGVPVVNVLSGYTNGTIITFDYSIELGLIIAQLQQLNINLGSQGSLIPGTLSNSSVATVKTLNKITTELQKIKNNSGALASAVNGVSASVDTTAKHMATGLAIQSMVAADQIQNNSFQQQATKEALKRNNLPEPQVPSIIETIKEKVKISSSIQTLSEFQGTINQITSKMISEMKNYIAETTIVKTATTQLSQLQKTISASLADIPSAQDLLNRSKNYLISNGIISADSPEI